MILRLMPRLLVAATAFAAATTSASADPARCTRTINAESAKYAQAVVKARQRCEDQKAAGGLSAGTDCGTNGLVSAAVAKAETRLRTHVGIACGGADHACGTADDDPLATIGWNVGNCPDLAQAGCNAPISSCTGIADCLTCAERAAVAQSLGTSGGSFTSGEFGTGSSVNRCQRAIGRETARFFRAATKALGRCWRDRLRGKHANACPVPGDGKAGPAIATAEARKLARICAACGGADAACGDGDDLTPSQIGFASTCPSVTVPDGGSCAASISALQPLVDCVDCVAAFDAECAALLAVPTVTSYPPSCGAAATPSTTTTTTTTSAGVTTTSTTGAPCPPPPPVVAGSVKITMLPGSTSCGTAQLPTGASPPLSGEVDFLDGSKRADLGVGCLYTGGGTSNAPPFSMPDGSQFIVDVAGVNGAAFTIVASNGTGPANCTKGAGPLSHCLNPGVGTDGQGLCTSDADCADVPGSCDKDANCFFGAPIPLTIGGTQAACVLNAVASDVCGSANLATNETSLSVNVSSRIYVTFDPASPCPQCVSGSCTAGARAGLSCTGGVGSKNTTVECPPENGRFAGRQAISFSGLTNGTATVSDSTGNFCPGQRHPGAFGGEAGTIRETGVPLASNPSDLFTTTFAGILCVPRTGSGLFDVVADLPGPAAVSVPVSLDICLLPEVCNTLCNPCNLGPLCATVCQQCLTCIHP
jgi:hypothetical protein